MISKISDSLIEILYGAFTLFAYYYITLTFVAFRPQPVFGFHPPMEMEQLGVVFVIILSVIACLKLLGELFVWINPPEASHRKFKHIPSQRV